MNTIKKWLIAEKITEKYDFTSLTNKLSNLTIPTEIKFCIKTIPLPNNDRYQPIPYKVAIIDFEGSPVILLGLMIHDTLFTYYRESHDNLDMFHLFILEILYQIRELTFFSFSEYEELGLLEMSIALVEKGFDLNKYRYLETLSVINLQKEKFESIAEAMFSSDSQFEFTGDPLFRNIKLIGKLFITKKFDDIISHNHTCLLNESIILKRWVKTYNLSRK